MALRHLVRRWPDSSLAPACYAIFVARINQAVLDAPSPIVVKPQCCQGTTAEHLRNRWSWPNSPMYSPLSRSAYHSMWLLRHSTITCVDTPVKVSRHSTRTLSDTSRTESGTRPCCHGLQRCSVQVASGTGMTIVSSLGVMRVRIQPHRWFIHPAVSQVCYETLRSLACCEAGHRKQNRSTMIDE